MQDSGERQATGPVGRDEWSNPRTFWHLVKSCSNGFPIDGHCPPLVLLPTSCPPPDLLGMEFWDEIRLLRVGVTTTGQAMDAKAFGGRTGLVSCSCVRSCESANIGVPPSTKAFRAAWSQSSIAGVRRGGKCYYLTVVVGATVGFAVRETAPAGMTHDDGFGRLRPRWFQLARRANSRPWLSRFMDRCRGSPWAAVPVCSFLKDVEMSMSSFLLLSSSPRRQHVHSAPGGFLPYSHSLSSASLPDVFCCCHLRTLTSLLFTSQIWMLAPRFSSTVTQG